jgi:hypothetical protein
MTMADIVQHFMRTHIPRDPALQKGTELAGAGERVAAIQGQVLASMEEGLYESMKIPTAGPGSEQRARAIADDAALMQLPAQLAQGQQVQFTVKDVFTALLKITSTSHASYQDFQKAVQPWLMVARKITGPRGNTGEGLFAPPNLFHVIAQNAHPGGYLGLQYMGHGLHYKMLNAPAGGANAPAQEPPKEPQAPRFGDPGGGN